MRLWAVLALLGMPLMAQSVQSRLAGRIPSDAVPVVDSLVQVALHEGLPSEPLVQKALEGGAKQVPSPRIVAAVQASLGQLRDAHELLVRAGDQPPIRAGEVTTVAWALRRKVPPSTVEQVVAELPHPPRAAAIHAIADLVAHGFDPDSSAGLIIAAVHDGLQRDRLLDVSTAALHEVQRGRTRDEAIAVVRQQLPNVPGPPKPERGTITRAHRPDTPSPP
ncbi:MAG TPA: hypothetical protein VEU73_14070 [Gemmatimonadales bacterium]|nr:hypothetical protein [Gemmatimonadales bacterium]